MLIVFRADASLEIGSGHLMRCLTLADLLRDLGARSMFFCRHLSPQLAGRIERQGHGLVRLTQPAQAAASVHPVAHATWLGTSWQADADETARQIAALDRPPDWLVVDHYALDARWEGVLRGHARAMLVVDDLADRAHDCDVLLDQNLHAAPEARYHGKVGGNCRLLLGPRHALLRPEFAAARQARLASPPQAERLLVFMGGVDNGNMTRTVLQGALALARPNLHLEVVVAASNPHLEALRSEFDAIPNVAIHVDVPDLGVRLAAADIAVGAGGGAMLERACLGMPSVTVAIAANQQPGAESLGRCGATLYLGRAAEVGAADIGHALALLLQSPTLRGALAERAAATVDGLGAGRVARLMLGNRLQLRLAGAGDCDNVYAWRNHPETRRYSGDGEVIDWPEHQRWFAAMLSDPGRRTLIAEDAGLPVGVVRYDIERDKADVSIYLVPGNQGRGFGAAILAAGEKWLAQACPAVRRLEAVVRPDNAASLRLFEAAGFEPCSAVLRKKVNANA